ncbi:unnamed protein product [Scytosiphon promiscuus]
MVDSDKSPTIKTLSRQLPALSASGWMNVQAPVRQGLEAVVTTANELAEQLAASRGETKRLEARLEGIEDMLSRRLDSNARSAREEANALSLVLDRVPRMVDVQTTASEACRTLGSELTQKVRDLERSVAEVRDESRKAVEAVRQAAAGKAGLSDLEAATRLDLQHLDNRIAKKVDEDALETNLATKVSWADFERLLRDKADASALADLSANCSTSATVERLEIGLARAVGMEEVRALVETQTGDLQAMHPALERLLAARAREEREVAERGPASTVTRGELPSLVRSSLLDLRDDGGDDGGLLPSRINAAQVQAAVSAGRESTLRTVEAQLARTRRAQQEEFLSQTKRLRLETDESAACVRARMDGLGKGLEQAKEELVSLLNAKAYKADVTASLQGKADSKDLNDIAALLRSKADEADQIEVSARTTHALTALSAEVGGLRGELRHDVDRLSNRLLVKADSDDLVALKKTISSAAAAAGEAATAVRTLTAPRSERRGSATATPAAGAADPENMSPLRFRSGGGRNGTGGDVCCGNITCKDGVAAHGGKSGGCSSRDGGGSVARSSRGGTGGGGLSREEARLLIRAELKRAGISSKITREEASVQAEECATRVADAVNLRVWAIGDRLDRSTVAVSQPHVERLFAAQSNLELRVTRSLGLGRWLWRGANFSGLAGEGVKGARDDDGGAEDGRAQPPPLPGGDFVSKGGAGVWVPWETEAANASPDNLKWTPGSTSVAVVVPGLYLISCGFFCELPFVATVRKGKRTQKYQSNGA